MEKVRKVRRIKAVQNEVETKLLQDALGFDPVTFSIAAERAGRALNGMLRESGMRMTMEISDLIVSIRLERQIFVMNGDESQA